MGEHVELALADRGQHLGGNVDRVEFEPPEFGLPGGQLARRACEVLRRRRP